MTAPIDRRRFLAALPALAFAPRVLAQSGAPPIRVRGLSQMTLTVSDLRRSLTFYQDLFGMPVQARHESTVLLRVGSGPQFLALKQAAIGETPSISAYGMAVDGFDLDRATMALATQGVTRVDGGNAATAPASMTARVTTRAAAGSRAGTRELFVADPSGIVFQLHDPAYCGGSGTRGDACAAPEASPAKGLFATRDISHFTINVTDQERTVAFYRAVFGFEVQVRQGAAPAWGVGPGVQFLMFAGGGPPAAGAAPRSSRIDHACLSMDGFNPDAVTKTLVSAGFTQRSSASREPRVTYISLRMPNRGGAEGGTPELYLTDPDGLAIQLQDNSYCGGGGFLGDVCPAL